MKVRLSGSARAYLRAEAAYLRDRSPRAATAFLAKLADARKNLARFPDIGRHIEALPIEESRRLVMGDYVLDYDVHGDAVVIVAIRHGKQSDVPPHPDDDQDYEDTAP